MANPNDHKCKCITKDYNDTVNYYVKDYCQKIRSHQVKEYRRKLYEEFTDNLTLHGYRQLVSEKGWRKVSWIIVMLILASFAVYLFFHMLRDFGHKTELEYEIQDGGLNLSYPTITICTNSPAYTKDSFRNFPLNITEDEFKQFYLEELSSVNHIYNRSAKSEDIIRRLAEHNITSYKDVLELFDNTIEDTTDVWKQFINGPTCYWGDKPCDLKTDFKETLHWKFSLCHQWNFYDKNGKPKTQSSGEETLTMLLNIHARNKLVSFYPFYGLVLYIHPYGTPHQLSSHTDSIGLQSGMFTSVDIGVTEVNLLPTPYSTGCGEKELTIIKKFPYSRALCEVDCVLVKIVEKCGCVGFDFENQVGDNIKICNVEEMKCYNRHLQDFKLTCIKHASTCPRECTYYKYHFQRSLVMTIGDEMMHDGFKKIKGWNKSHVETEHYMRQNLLGFEIGYKSLSQLRENYRPSVTFSEVVGVVGGSIGLCLGFSFVTGYEVLFFLFDYITAPWKFKQIYNAQNGNAK